MFITLAIFILLISILILIHEAGHFLTAKKLGMKVEEFGFGFPPRLWGIRKGETIYSINWLPIGGFVKVYGEDEAGAGRIKLPDGKNKVAANKRDLSRAFSHRPRWQQFIVVFAGVAMNTLLAIGIYYLFIFLSNFQTELPYVGEHRFFLVNQQVNTYIIINDVTKNSPAEDVGIPPQSKIIAVNGQRVTDPDKFSKIIEEYKGKQLALTIQDINTQKEFTKIITPRINPPKDEGALGIEFYPQKTVTLSYNTQLQKYLSGIIHPANLMVYNFAVLKKLITISVQEKTVEPVSHAVSGPLGIYKIVGDFMMIPDIKERSMQLLNLAGLLSISLAFFNLLPIPGLDGGRLFFILIESITQKKLDPKFEAYANMIGILFLIILIILITGKDILQFFLK